MEGRHRLLLTAARAALWATLFICTVAFLGVTALRPTDFFVNNQVFKHARDATTIAFPGHVPLKRDVVVEDGLLKEEVVGTDEPIFVGDQGFVVTLQWGTVLLAGLAAAALRWLRQQPGAQEAARLYEPYDPAAAAAQNTRWARLQRKVQRVLFYPVPPHKVWVHYLGGLTVLELMVFSVWCTLLFLYLYYEITPKFQQVAATAQDANDWAIQRLQGASISFGEALRFVMMVMFFPVGRSSFLRWLLGTNFEALVKYHKWMGVGTVVLSTAHGIMFLVLWGSQGIITDMISFKTDDSSSNVQGLVSMLVLLLLAATSTAWVRKNYYKMFYRTHIAGFLVFVIFIILHDKYMVYWVLPALILYGLDRAFRYWQLAFNWTRVTSADVAVDGNIMTLCLSWKRAFDAILPGQTVYLRVPALSLFYSHPFSVADVSEEGDFVRATFHIRVGGDWTQGLMDRLSNGQTLRVQVEGPYESKLDYLSAAPAVVMIAGGTGVTPLLSVLRRYARLGAGGARVPQVHFLWTSRSLCELRMLGSDLLAAATHMPYQPRPKDTLSLATNSTGSSSSSNTSSSNTASNSDHSNNGFPAPWLHADIHYTGFEMEECQLPNPQLELTSHLLKQLELPVWKKPSADLASIAQSLGLNMGSMHVVPPPPSRHDIEQGAPGPEPPARAPLLSPHPANSTWVYVVSIILTFVGAWAGLLFAGFYVAYGLRTTEDGYFYVAVGVLQIVCITVGALLPTFVFLALVHEVRKATARPATTSASSLPSTQPSAMSSYLYNALTVLPGYILAPATSTSDLDNLQLARGRPKFANLLQRVRARYPHLQQIDVLVAGPDSLCEAVDDLCRQQAPGGPEMICRRAAYHT